MKAKKQTRTMSSRGREQRNACISHPSPDKLSHRDGGVESGVSDFFAFKVLHSILSTNIAAVRHQISGCKLASLSHHSITRSILLQP
jgi:hypothetical protein